MVMIGKSNSVSRQTGGGGHKTAAADSNKLSYLLSE